MSPYLSRAGRIRVAPPNNGIYNLSDDSFLRPVGGDKTNSGLNSHLVVMDELHAWTERHRGFKDELETGSGMRPQPLNVIITTAGDDNSLIWQEEDRYATTVLESAAIGAHVDDALFAYVARLDPEDDPFDPSVWAKANPNLGVTVHQDYLERAASEAKARPTDFHKFARFHLNIKVTSTERAFTETDWVKGSQPLTITDGAYGHGGIDMALSRDLCAASIVFPIVENERIVRWEVVSKSWCVSGGDLRIEHEPWRTWIREGKLEVHRGDTFDQSEIKRQILEWAEKYNVQTWAYDPAHASLLGTQLVNEHGLAMFKFTQAHRYYNEPCEQFSAAVRAGQIIHGGDPVLQWQALNMEWDRNSANLVMPDKSKLDNKIDAMVATLMAYSECLFAAKQQASYYDSNPLEAR
jgi:phage terminase large subunit-like protein